MKFLWIMKSISLCLFILTANSCKKTSGTFAPETGPDTDGESEPVEKKLILPVKMVYDRLTTEFDYLPNTALLKEIRKSTGYRYIFLYDSKNLLFEYQIYQNDKLAYFAQFARDAQDNITKIIRFDVDLEYGHTYFPKGNYQVEFNSKKQLSKIQAYGANKKLMEERNLEYDTQNSLVKITSKAEGMESVANLQYDQKNGIYKNIAYLPLILIVHEDATLLNSMHNVIRYNDSSNPAEDRTASYEYNPNNYPSKMMVNRKSWKENHLITYKEVNLP
jgi:hypothetical protein